MDLNNSENSVSKFLVLFGLLVFGRICNAYMEYDIEDACAKGTFAVKLSKEGIDSVAILRATRHTSYRYALRCIVEIFVPDNDKDPTDRCGLTISLMHIQLRPEMDGVCQDSVKIYKGFGGSGPELYAGCVSYRDLTESQSYDSEDGLMSVVYETAKENLDNKTMSGFSGFQFTITAFHKQQHSNTSNDTSSSSTYFRCDNGKYVWSELTCDGHNNCGDLSDESVDGSSQCKMSKGYTLYIVVGSVLAGSFFIAAIVLLVCQKKVKRKRRQTLKALIRTRREMASPNIQHSQIS